MSASISHDWIFLTPALVLGLAGQFLLYWSLLKDSSRGRRRCPNCWYDLNGTPGNLTCSECGRTVRHERKFFRTRRRWGWANVSLITLALATGAGLYPWAQRRGIETLVPTTALVLMAPELSLPPNAPSMAAIFPTSAPAFSWNFTATTAPAPTPPTPLVALTKPSWRYRLNDQLMRRIEDDHLWSWQWRWLIWRCWDDTRPPWTIELTTRSAWADNDLICIAPQISCNPSHYPWLEKGRYRVRIRPRVASAGESLYSLYETDGPKPVSQATNPWRERLCLGRHLSADVHSVDCDVWMERCPARDPEKPWRAIWHECITVAIGHSGKDRPRLEALKDYAIDDMIRRSIVGIDRTGLRIHWPLPPKSGPAMLHPTLAIRFELQGGGQTLAVARAWWSTNDPREALTVGPLTKGFPYTVRWDQPINEDQFNSIGHDDNTWTLRMISDAELALHDVRSSRYWEGALEMPVKVAQQSDVRVAVKAVIDRNE